MTQTKRPLKSYEWTFPSQNVIALNQYGSATAFTTQTWQNNNDNKWCCRQIKNEFRKREREREIGREISSNWNRIVWECEQ